MTDKPPSDVPHLSGRGEGLIAVIAVLIFAILVVGAAWL